MSFSMTLFRNANQGNRLNGAYPLGDEPASPPVSEGFGGWKSVTDYVDATGSGTRYDIGPAGATGTDLADVPWHTLQPGDAVNVAYRATPYREKIVITEAGTAANPIIINGVSDANGNRPIIDGDGAVNISPTMYNATVFEETLVMFHRKPVAQGGVFAQTADHVHFQNFHLRNADTTYTYTHDGVTSSYGDTARIIWIYANEYIKIENCIIESAGEGIFAGAPGEKPSKTLHIKGNRFVDCGFPSPPATFAAHQIYLAGYADPGEYNIIEGNFFDAIGDTSVAQCKLRTPGTIVRYNFFRKGGRTLDIVEAQDSTQDLIWTNYTAQEILDYYRTSYVYGNMFLIDEDVDSSAFTYPCHFGWDSLENYLQGPATGEITGRGVGSPTYFYNNTMYFKLSTSTTYRGGLFDVDGGSANANTSSIVAMNNVIEFAGDGRIGQMRFTGDLTWQGANLIYSTPLTILAESDSYANTENAGDDPAVAITNNDTRITTSAGFVDGTNVDWLSRDYSLGGSSPALNVGATLPSPMSNFPPQYSPANPSTGAVPSRSSTNHIGAYE